MKDINYMPFVLWKVNGWVNSLYKVVAESDNEKKILLLNKANWDSGNPETIRATEFIDPKYSYKQELRLRQVDNEQRDWRSVEVKQSKEDRDDEQRVEPDLLTVCIEGQPNN